MAARNVARAVALSDEQRKQLEFFTASRSLQHAQVERAKIILKAAAGMQNIQIAEELSTTRETVGKWRKRFVEQGIEGLYDVLRPGRTRSIEDERLAELIRKTLETKPEGATHWSCRTMAETIGLSKSTVQRVWSTFGVQPIGSAISNCPMIRSWWRRCEISWGCT
jgi:putative transposase